jgi:hypothetical protein
MPRLFIQVDRIVAVHNSCFTTQQEHIEAVSALQVTMHRCVAFTYHIVSSKKLVTASSKVYLKSATRTPKLLQHDK